MSVSTFAQRGGGRSESGSERGWGGGLTGCGKRGEAAAIGALRSIYPVDFGSSPGGPTAHAPHRMGPGALTSRLRESGGPPTPPWRHPFQEGSLRSVFFMKDFSYPPGPPQDFVAKISKDPGQPPHQPHLAPLGPRACSHHVAQWLSQWDPIPIRHSCPRINCTPIAGNFLVCATKVVIFQLHFFRCRWHFESRVVGLATRVGLGPTSRWTPTSRTVRCRPSPPSTPKSSVS